MFAARARLAASLVGRRFYATEAPSSGKLIVNLTVPHQVILGKYEAKQVNLASSEGDMGILANHVPTIAQLRPGVLEVFGADKTTKFFVSGGFAVINPDSSLNINAIEAVSLSDLDFEAAKRGAEDATKRLSVGSEEDKVTAKIELELFEAVVAAAKH
ncbi:delta subunit of the central stalk of mitochondrial F1F0 ATP synthase, atp16 [Polyrhizophydium stewartii]|uniref:ATP synthase subunit delta, mitochondrial n=1 Tax=Polyrhizophydium stewartii TaxID=2732419 RepID=A0ABR4N0Y6_9FUNG